jgi:predicted nicotinamide N-methyase
LRTRHFLTRQESIAVAGVANLEIRSLLDRQQYHDPAGQAEGLGISSAAWPLFGMLWPSAARLAARMAARNLIANERILEIGCGLALPSLVAHRRGADVTASDRHPLAADFLRHNLQLNNLLPMKYQFANWSGAAGQATPLANGFDLIVGSDVLYERDVNGDLAAMIECNVRPAAEIWIVDPDRGNRGPFNRRMSSYGFACREERLDCAATAQDDAYKGRLLIYVR